MLFRHKLQAFLIVAFVLIAAAATGDAWIAWSALAAIAVVLLSVDCMFFDDSQFIYDPDYKNWSRRTDPQY